MIDIIGIMAVERRVMKKANFDLGTAAVAPTSRCDLRHAERVLERNKLRLQASGVVGMWIGAKASRPYIMIAVNQNRGKELRQMIPDSLEGISVYYVEGTPAY
jgi:hypothetical protein